ncbi:PREDICTED: tRNA wybutosine-synthesizing protein 2 homolog isoform X2 [Haliaeetus leucocephalus]|uniref:tRNA wybutosine-synthesizing protein 2 homolog isoform X2 n=1 Tax=Haliaeetus leucocephalus TaxID=52644 RepID=UPI00053CC10F|nr:PREDICTED: tRNA wybutosine-synthesizing protein 2 homolog isoform X2 [Haliaeetus leucocephalus]
MEARDVPVPIPALATEPRFVQRLREHLEEEQLLDGRYRLQEVPGGRVALPVVEEKLSQLRLPQEIPCGLVQIQDPVPSRAARRQTPAQKLRDELRRLLGKSWSEELERDVPRAWQRHGDLVLLSEDCFRAAPWEKLGPALWETVASALGGRRLARRGRVLPDGMRSPSVTLLLGQDGWVEHVDNGIRYTFDVTKCMFSPGNITEKLRVASLPCSGEVLVDLYAEEGGMNFHFPSIWACSNPEQSRFRELGWQSASHPASGEERGPPGGTGTLPSALPPPAPRHRLFHAAVPGSRSGCLCPCLRVERPCRGGPAQEPGTERCAGPLPHPPRGQPAAGAAGHSGPGEPGADSQLGGRLASGLLCPEEGHGWGSPHPPQRGDSPLTGPSANPSPAG